MKLLVRLLLGLASLLVLLGVGAVFFVDSLVEQAVERGGTHALGVETRLARASIGLFSGRFALSGLGVANPPSFQHPDFFALRRAELELPLASLVEQRITIPSLALEGITIDLERNAEGTNYAVILDNLARFESGSAPADASEPTGDGGKTFLLQELVIRDVRAAVNLVPGGGDLTRLSLSIPAIVVEDLASDMTLAEICALVVKTVLRSAIQAGEDVLPEELLTDLRGRMDHLEGVARDRLDAKLGELEEKLREQARKLGSGAEKALGKKLDGLLEKKKD